MDRLGKYELRAVLGRGAMGTVYEGWDPVIARRVAIKTVRQPDDADSEEREQLDRFQQEAQAAGRLHHPNIVGVFDYAETGEIAYIVMEFVPGRSLKAVLDAGAVPPAEIGPLMDGLLSGLEYSHAHQVIHRDIKPANVIVTEDGAIKIADFGIARIGSSTMTQAGTIMGTPAYMSPEQFQGGAIDQRTDIYSAGVLLYQLLTGRRPFEGNMATIMHDVLTGPAPVPSAVLPAVSPALDGVVARAMSRAPADRFPDAGAFNQALQRALRAPVLPAGLGDLVDEDATVVTPAGGGKAGGARQGGTGRGGTGTASSTAPSQTAAAKRGAPPRRQGWLLPAAAAILLTLGGGGGYWVWQGRMPARQGNETTGDQAARRTGTVDQGGQGGMGQDGNTRSRDAPDGTLPDGAARDRTAQNGTAPDQGGAVSGTRDQAGPLPDGTASTKPPELQADGKDHRDGPSGVGDAGGPGPITQGTTPPGSDTGRQPDQVKPQQQSPDPGKPPGTQLADNTGSGTRPDAAIPPDPPRPPPARPPAVVRAAVADALRRVPCTAVTGDLRPSGVIALRGVAASGPAASTLRDAVADAAPGAPTDWSLSAAEGPYCAMLDLVRPLLRPFGSEARTVGLTLRDGKTDLVADDLMFPVITLPDVPSYMQVDYIASDGSVAHLVNATPGPAIPANTLRTLGEPKPPSFPGYIVDKPFGTDMLVVFTSNAPLFRTARPDVETADTYLPLLRAALDAAQRNGMRTWAAVLMVRTLPKPKL